MLTIGNEGEARFFGSFAGSEYLRDVRDEDKGNEGDEGNNGGLQTEGEASSSSYGLGPGSRISGLRGDEVPGDNNEVPLFDTPTQSNLMSLQRQLPRWETEGRDLVENYFQNVDWM
jgi:hypothetical protein